MSAQIKVLRGEKGDIMINIKAITPEATTEGVIRPLKKEWDTGKILSLIGENRQSVTWGCCEEC
jgi:hypothetical protein